MHGIIVSPRTLWAMSAVLSASCDFSTLGLSEGPAGESMDACELSAGSAEDTAAPSGTGESLVLYDDTVASGWEMKPNKADVDLFSSDPVHHGTAAAAVTITGGWGEMNFSADPPQSTNDYTEVRFWIHGGNAGGQDLDFMVVPHIGGIACWDASASMRITPQANCWREVKFELSSLGSPAKIAALVWISNSGHALPTFYVDDVTLIGRQAEDAGGESTSGGDAPESCPEK